MLRKYWVGTGTIQRKPNDSDISGDNPNYSPTIDIGVEIQGHILTIEPSGALTVWRENDDERSTLVMAFAHGHWTKAHEVQS